MFYFILQPILIYNFILIAAAVIPAVVLMIKVYQSDRLDRESPWLLWDLMKVGILSSLLALVLERILSFLLGMMVSAESPIYNVILYFIVVACSEEGAKYAFLKKETWNSPEFNCQYDGVLYAVFVSLGFALWENISYVMTYGFSTAIVRAVTAIPGHACFGVFMGVFYGIAKKYDNRRRTEISGIYRKLAVVVPVILHGAYDYIASKEASGTGWVFVLFVIVLFGISYILVNRASEMDRYID